MRIAILFTAMLAVLSCCITACAAPQTAAGRVVVHTEWSTAALFLSLQVDDPMVVGDQTSLSSQPWLDDAVAVYLDLNPTDGDALNEHCVRVIVSAAGGVAVQRGKDGAWADDPTWFGFSRYGTIRYGVQVNGKLNDSSKVDSGYHVELALPWGLLRAVPPIRQHAEDDLPAIGFALACYAQGETQSVSCWPQQLVEADATRPARWGRLQFTQTPQPVISREPLATATLYHGEPKIDGKLEGFEWMTAGVCTFTKRQGTVTVAPAEGRHAVSTVAAWYTLDPVGRPSAHQPLEVMTPGLGPDSPLYHLQQLREVRQAGIDALAVVLPVGAGQEKTRERLAALAGAVQAYDRANPAEFFTDTPLLMPLLDLRDGASPSLAQQALDEFYLLVPPQFRLMAPLENGAWCYPVACVISTKEPNACPPLNLLAVGLQQRWGRPVGWLLDAAWPGATETKDVLARCAWDPAPGVQIGDGPLRTVLVSPGVDAGKDRFVSRRAGEFYANGWLKIRSARPDFILIRSWNDFAEGTEIAPSRQFGAQYRDATRLHTIEMIKEREYGIRVLQQNLPAVLAASAGYPVELIVKNGGTEQMAARAGFRVDYRLERGDRQVAKGIATENIALLQLATARLRFTLPTESGRNKNLPAGDYILHLDFRRNKIARITLPFMTETVWTVSVPITIGEGNEVAQALRCETPAVVPAGQPAPVSATLRFPEKGVGRKTRIAFRAGWANADGSPLAGEAALTTKKAPGPGEAGTYTGELPPAPEQPGWYQVRVEMVKAGGPAVPVHTALVRVADTDLRGQFLNIGLPNKISDVKTVEVPIALRNEGQTDWTQAAITYQWLTWDGRPLAGAAGSVALEDAVPADSPATVRIDLPLPAGMGPLRCAFGLSSGGQAVTLTMSPIAPNYPVCATVLRPERFQQVDLSRAFNPRDYSAQAATLTIGGGLDGRGDLFPLEEFLPDATRSLYGYTVGYMQNADPAPEFAGVPFFFAFPVDGRTPVVRAAGQEIPLPNINASALFLAAVNTYNNEPCQLILRYTEGEEQQVSLNLSHWLVAPQYGEPVLLRTRYLRTLMGDDWNWSGSIFAYRIPTDPARTLASIVLPKQQQVCLFAATLTMAP
ncbi:MAG: sugar-binding protein [Armatimonadota bacterium]